MKDITVFISYAWESEEIKKFARWLGYFLNKYGIEVKLDTFNLYPGSDLQQYMQDGLTQSKYVISIVTESYKKKMDDPKTGVGTEIQHIEKMGSKPYIIPIVHNEQFIDLPELFDGKFVTKVDMHNPTSLANKDEIFKLITIFANKEGILPDKASNPIENYEMTSKKYQLKSSIFDNMQFDIELEDTVRFYYASNGKNFTIGYKEMSFITRWSKCGNDSIHSYNKENTLCRIPSLNTLKKINSISNIEDLSQQNINWGGKFNIGDGLLWINKHDVVAIGLIKEIYTVDEDFDCYVEFDYKILNPIENESPFKEQS